MKLFYGPSAIAYAIAAMTSGCSFVSTIERQTFANAPLATDLVATSGQAAGPSNLSGTRFQSIINWAGVGGGSVQIEQRALTLLHAPSAVSPLSSANEGLQVFSATDFFEVDSNALSPTFVPVSVADNSILGRVEEAELTGATARSFVGYTSAGFLTPFEDIIALGTNGGTARYMGVAALEVFEANGHTDIAAGTSDITIDFGANAMSGSLSFTDVAEGGSGFDITNVTIDIAEGSLIGNSFSGTMSTQAGSVGAANLGPITMEGGLFGPLGSEMNGTFSASGDSLINSGSDIVMLGGFLGSQ